MELSSDSHNQVVDLHEYVLEHWKAVWDREQCSTAGMSCAYHLWTPPTKKQWCSQSGETRKNTP